MGFLDKQTRVLDIQLTPYGKQQLAKGQWSPEYYAFFDDDVLYDTRYAGYSEPQNDAQDRIIKNTPILETQVVFASRESEVKRNNQYILQGERDQDGNLKRLGGKEVQNTSEKHYALNAPLGTIRLDAEAAPAWSVNVLQGEISGTTATKSADHPTVRIPQLSMSPVEFKTTVEQDQPPETEDDTLIQDPDISNDEMDLESFTRKFEDGSYLRIFKDFLLLEVTEENTDFEAENFDIEVYQIEEYEDPFTKETREELVPLNFQTAKPQVVNDILVEEEQTELPDLDSSYVQYYFDVLVDEEIDPQVLCKLSPADRPEGLFGQRLVDCVEPVPEPERQLYESNVKQEDLEEEC